MTDSDTGKADLSALKIDRSRMSSAPGRWKRWLHLLWLLLPVVLYFAYQLTIKKVTPSVKVRIDTVRYLTGVDATSELVATGYVVAQIKASVASKATGRLEVLNVEEGDSVKADEIIAILENNDIIAELDIVKARLKQAQADSLATGLNFERQKKLFDQGFVTQETVESATALYYRTVADVEAMAASVRAAEVAVENTIIRAPFDGTVLTKNADVGEMVAPMAATASSRGAVVTLADMSSLEVEADVSESNIQKVIVGQPCQIVLDAYPYQKYDGFVKKIVPTADRTRATVMTKIAFKNIDNRVLPEMSARVNFLSKKETADEKAVPILIIDSDAITMRNNQPVAFLVVDNLAQQVIIETGRKLGDVTELISGLNKGDRVILSPAGGLKSGDKVEIIN